LSVRMVGTSMRIRRRGLLSGFPDKAMQEPQAMEREGHDL